MVTMKRYNCVECDSFQRQWLKIQEFTSWSFINFKTIKNLNDY
jgi:hypothetical protein